MSYLATYKVPTADWQDWLDGKVAFDTDKGACVSLEECEETRKEVREYWLGWGAPEETVGGRLAYNSNVCLRSEMTEVEVVDRSTWYDGRATGFGTRYELSDDPGNAFTLVACDMGDGTTEVWHDGYGV